MLRLPPFDQIGATPTPDFVNADPANSVKGSIVNGLVFNQIQHEGENLELLAGLTPSGTDLTQWSQAVGRGIWLGQLGGTSDALTGTLGTPVPALLQGMRVRGVAAYANTTTTPKIRIYGIGSATGYIDFPILKADGSALSTGEVVAGRRYEFEVDGSSPANVLITGGGIGSSSSQSAAQTAKSGFNTQIFQSTARVLLSQSGANALATALSGLSFTKNSATSLVRVNGSFIFRCASSPGNGYGPTYYVLSLGGLSIQQATSNAYPLVVALTPVNLTLGTKASPLAKGTYPLALQFGRADTSQWSGTFLPSSADESGYPASTLFQISVDEVEPN